MKHNKIKLNYILYKKFMNLPLGAMLETFLFFFNIKTDKLL